MSSAKLMARPIPSLSEWLGDGARADGFEEWVAESIAVEGELKDPEQAAVVRMVRTFSIAMVEICRIEDERHLRTAHQIFPALARAAGVAIAAALASAIDHDQARAFPKLTRTMSEEFHHGAKVFLDAATRKNR